jgi:hypothetical protein
VSLAKAPQVVRDDPNNAVGLQGVPAAVAPDNGDQRAQAVGCGTSPCPNPPWQTALTAFRCAGPGSDPGEQQLAREVRVRLRPGPRELRVRRSGVRPRPSGRSTQSEGEAQTQVREAVWLEVTKPPGSVPRQRSFPGEGGTSFRPPQRRLAGASARIVGRGEIVESSGGGPWRDRGDKVFWEEGRRARPERQVLRASRTLPTRAGRES